MMFNSFFSCFASCLRKYILYWPDSLLIHQLWGRPSGRHEHQHAGFQHQSGDLKSHRKSDGHGIVTKCNITTYTCLPVSHNPEKVYTCTKAYTMNVCLFLLACSDFTSLIRALGPHLLGCIHNNDTIIRFLVSHRLCLDTLGYNRHNTVGS